MTHRGEEDGATKIKQTSKWRHLNPPPLSYHCFLLACLPWKMHSYLCKWVINSGLEAKLWGADLEQQISVFLTFLTKLAKSFPSKIDKFLKTFICIVPWKFFKPDGFPYVQCSYYYFITDCLMASVEKAWWPQQMDNKSLNLDFLLLPAIAFLI